MQDDMTLQQSFSWHKSKTSIRVLWVTDLKIYASAFHGQLSAWKWCYIQWREESEELQSELEPNQLDLKHAQFQNS